MRAKKYIKKTKVETVEVREEFFPYQTKVLDSKNRITLGGKITQGRAESYKVFIGKNGDILLRPVISVPANEAWVYQNPKVVGKLRKGLKEASEEDVEKVDDLDSFLESL